MLKFIQCRHHNKKVLNLIKISHDYVSDLYIKNKYYFEVYVRTIYQCYIDMYVGMYERNYISMLEFVGPNQSFLDIDQSISIKKMIYKDQKIQEKNFITI